jgi:putative ABC transport system permease protein
MLNDLRYALRTLLKSPGFTIVAVLALALGSGVNTAIFSVIDAVLLRPLPFPNSARLVQMNEQATGIAAQNLRPISLSYPNFLDLRDRSRAFEKIAGYRERGMNLTGSDRAIRVSGIQVNWEFFDLTGARPLIGRGFSPAEDRVEAEPVAVITAGLWRRAFGKEASILGGKIRLDSRDYTVIGVLPALPEPFAGTDVLVPLSLFAVKDDGMLNRGNHTGLYALGALAPGMSVAKAQAELTRISEDLEKSYPQFNAGTRAVITPFLDTMVSQVRPGLWMLFAAVGFVLLIACVNVANLTLARSSARRREVAVRAALGAARGAIVRQFLVESLVLATGGAALGAIAAAWAVDALRRFGPADVARLSQAQLNPQVLMFTTLLIAISAILFGLAPAIGASRTDVMEAMRTGSRGETAPHARDRMRNALLAAEVALSMVLLAGAGLMLRTVLEISRVDPGFDARGVLALDLHAQGYNEEQTKAFWERALDRIRAIPGVRAASATLNPPFEHSQWSSIFMATNGPVMDRAHMPEARFTTVATGYFEAMGIRLLGGREFRSGDDGKHAFAVIVNQTLARAIWGDRDPIGQRIKQGNPEMQAPWVEVVGVVSDTRQIALDVPAQMEIYLPLTEDAESDLTIVVRAADDPMRLAPAIEGEIHQLDPNLPVYNVRTMQQKFAASYARQRFLTALLTIFAGVALALACVGIFGVTSYMVARATREIGVRMALGARRADILAMILGRAIAPSAAGLALGLVCAIAAARALRSMLFGVSAADPATLVAVAGLFLIAALAASLIPAYRAMRVAPIEALRDE